jgi:formylglycine-generating enzyme required for sulfatase activity
MPLDLVAMRACTVAFGEDLETVKATWRSHADLDLPWHYFAKQTGHEERAIASFAVQRCPVTWAELDEVDRHLVARLKPVGERWECPADNLTFANAVELTRLLQDHHGLALRLPTEFEWEYVARGREDRVYPWGDVFDPGCCNLAEAGLGQTEPVGSRPDGASEDGILDLAGNVDEWTSSLYAPFEGTHWTTPRIETWAVDPHVTRGGSFSHHRDLGLSRRRHAVYRPWNGAGFRLAMDL